MSDDFEEKLDNPLVVHKETDASYEENISELDVNVTHIEEDTATLERHRFRKVKKKSKVPYLIFAVIAIITVFAGFYYGGIIPNFLDKETAEAPLLSDNSEITEENRFEGIITVKGTYLFFEGREINGAEELISEIKYIDSSKKFVVQDESADSTFLNDEILPLLTSYNIQYEVKHIISSGLKSVNETTSVQQISELESDNSAVNIENTNAE